MLAGSYFLAFLNYEQENLNVFVIDWVNGARDLYGKSVQNTRVVGRVIGRTMQFLNTETGAQFDRMHLIGHSLGAHISGFAGAFQPGIGRISGKIIEHHDNFVFANRLLKEYMNNEVAT